MRHYLRRHQSLRVVDREFRLAPLLWPRRVDDGEALVLDAVEADVAPVWMCALWLEALVNASNASRCMVGRVGEPHARAEAISARLHDVTRRLSWGGGRAPHGGERWVGLACTSPAAWRSAWLTCSSMG